MSDKADINASVNESAHVRVSVLITREEYSRAAGYLRRTRYKVISPGVIAGAPVCVGGAGCLLFSGRTDIPVPWAISIIACGLFLLLLDTVFAPMMARASAAADYDTLPDLHYSVLYTFDEDSVTIKSSGAEGTLPLSLMTKCSETPDMFVIRFGDEFLFCIPKRLLDRGGKSLRMILQRQLTNNN